MQTVATCSYKMRCSGQGTEDRGKKYPNIILLPDEMTAPSLFTLNRNCDIKGSTELVCYLLLFKSLHKVIIIKEITTTLQAI